MRLKKACTEKYKLSKCLCWEQGKSLIAFGYTYFCTKMDDSMKGDIGGIYMYQKEHGEKVWAAFKEMDTYLDKSFQIIERVDENNNYYNTKGQTMYDGVSTLLNTNIGHRNSEMIEAITQQLNTLDNTTLFCATNDVAIKCARKLCSMTGNHFFSVFFTNSGSEACDTALKIAMKYNYNKGRRNVGVVALQGAYHGSNMTAMRLCQDQYDREQYFVNSDGYYRLEIPISEGVNSGKSVKQSSYPILFMNYLRIL